MMVAFLIQVGTITGLKSLQLPWLKMEDAGNGEFCHLFGRIGRRKKGFQCRILRWFARVCLIMFNLIMSKPSVFLMFLFFFVQVF